MKQLTRTFALGFDVLLLLSALLLMVKFKSKREKNAKKENMLLSAF